MLIFNIPESGAETAPDGFVDIDDYIDIVCRNEDERIALAEARNEIAKDLYGEQLSIASLRLKAGWSQRDLARIIGTQQPHICRIEAGTTDLQLSTLKKLADAFNTPLGKLTEALAHQNEGANG